MTALIYLAGGNSARFGSNKLLYNIAGKPMYLHLLERLDRLCSKNSHRKLFCVTQYKEIIQAVQDKNINAVYSPESKDGISYSIKAGIKAACGEAVPDRVVFFVADQPYMTEKTVESFLGFAESCDKGICCVCHNGISGNPVSFDRKYISGLLELTGDTGGKSIVKKHPEDTGYFKITDANELKDIDVCY